MPKDLLDMIEKNMSKLSKGQKLIAKYILEHYEKAAFMTAAKLAESVDTSESTVVRFASKLGFDGYPKLQKKLQELIKNKLTSVQRVELSTNRIDEDNILKSVLKSDIEKIKITLNEVNEDSFNKIVESIILAENIYIIAVRGAAPLGSFLGLNFNLIFNNVRIVHTTDESEMFEQIFRAKKGDVVIGISFPRYSKRTIKAMEHTKANGARIIGITDSVESPLAILSDLYITARSDMVFFADSLVGPLSIINALIVAVGIKRKDSLYNTLEQLETLWDKYEIYEKKKV